MVFSEGVVVLYTLSDPEFHLRSKINHVLKSRSCMSTRPCSNPVSSIFASFEKLRSPASCMS